MSSVQPLLLSSGTALSGAPDSEEFGVIPEAEGAVPPPNSPIPNVGRRDRQNGQGQRQIKPRNIRTALKKLWLDEMLLTKQILCPVPGCTMVFQTLQAIQTHYQFCTGLNESGIVRCEYCGEQFLSQSLALEIHTAEEHRQDRLMSMSKAEDQIGVSVKTEPQNSQQLSQNHQAAYNSSNIRVKKFRETAEMISLASTPPPSAPDIMIESRRRSVAFSRNQEELIDCEELEGVVRFPLRNLPKGEPEDPLQLPAVMMNLDINLKPRPLSFDDLDENSLMDDALLLAGPLKLKSEPLDKAEDDPHYLSDVINKMPEPDLKTVPPVRKRPRQQQQQQQHSSGPDVRVVQVIMRSNSSEPNAAQSILRDPQFVDAIVQQTMGSLVQNGQPQTGSCTPRRKKRKTSQQSVVVVAFNEPAQEQTSPATIAQNTVPVMAPPIAAPPTAAPRAAGGGQPNIMKKGVRNRKQIFPPTSTPTSLVQVTSSLDPGHKFLQTHTLAPGDKPQVQQEVIDSFFNSASVSTASTTIPTTAISCHQSGGLQVTTVASQPSTSFVDDSSHLVQQSQNIQPVIVHQHQPQSIPHAQQMSAMTHSAPAGHADHEAAFQQQHVHQVGHGHHNQQQSQQHLQQQQQQQLQQQQQQQLQQQQQQQQLQQQQNIVQQTEDFQTVQVVSSPDVLSHLGDQGCLIVPQEAFGQLEGAQLIVHEGQIIVQNKNGERVEGCQVVYGNAAFTTEAALAVAQEDFSGNQHAATLQQLQTADVVGSLQLAQDGQQVAVQHQQEQHHHHLHEQQPAQQQHHTEQATTQQLVVEGGNGVVITQVESPMMQVATHTVAGAAGDHLASTGNMASLVMSGQLEVIPVDSEQAQDNEKQQQSHQSGEDQTLSETDQADAVQISIISMKEADEAVDQQQQQHVQEQMVGVHCVQELHDSSDVVRHESIGDAQATIEQEAEAMDSEQARSIEEAMQDVVVQQDDVVCTTENGPESKEDADTTATQAAEALLTLRPQQKQSSPQPACPALDLPEELQLLHRSQDGATTQGDGQGEGKPDETPCRGAEVFQMMPESQNIEEANQDSGSAAVATSMTADGATHAEDTHPTVDLGGNEHVELSSVGVHPVAGASATEPDSDLVVVEADKYSSVQA